MAKNIALWLLSVTLAFGLGFVLSQKNAFSCVSSCCKCDSSHGACAK